MVSKADTVLLNDPHRTHAPAWSDHQAGRVHRSGWGARGMWGGMEMCVPSSSNTFGGDRRRREFREGFIDEMTFKPWTEGWAGIYWVNMGSVFQTQGEMWGWAYSSLEEQRTVVWLDLSMQRDSVREEAAAGEAGRGRGCWWKEPSLS